ncbi:MAG: hypothetical protein NTW85_13365 [Methylococcales bacterium]|nr:hypothetical protein [Methylococcales bacterium]
MTNYKEELFKLEKRHIDNFKNGNIKEQDNIQNKINILHINNIQDLNTYIMKSINTIRDLCVDVNLSKKLLSDIMTDIKKTDFENISNVIDENIIVKSKGFVSLLLNVDLSKVKFYDLKVNKNNIYAEACCINCGEDEHHIFYYSEEFTSTDLIVHELGHAAEFSISRKVKDDQFTSHSCISEAVAYFCQFKYLLENGSRQQRSGAVAAFIYTYLAILVLSYCLKNKLELSDIIPEKLIDESMFKDFLEIYGDNGRSFIVEKINHIKNTNAELINLVGSEISPRFGVVLALILLKKDISIILKIISMNSITENLDSILNIIDNDITGSLKNIDKLILSFIDG